MEVYIREGATGCYIGRSIIQGIGQEQKDSIFDLLSAEMDTDGDFTIDGIVSLHLGQKRPLIEGLQGNLGQLMMRSRLKDNDRCFPFFTNKKPGLEPIIEFL